ncbi:hypothetical protein R1sor_003297 [Riccia sorocarpa]|uniref:Uncharacterized protein n=1 Tax=Riccia sorocarpa TaxID=122646 RepID=A0ABD3H163_9MARC
MDSVSYHRSRGVVYYLPSPWPETFSLSQTCRLEKTCKEFSHSSIAQYIGRIGILPRWWTEDRQDWYLDILQFVCVRTVRRGEETVLGPFSVVRSEADFILLEDENQQQFYFPKYLQRYEFGRKFYSSTAIWLYTSGCYYRRCVDLEIPLPVHCFCIEVFNRTICLGCSYDPRVHPREENEDTGSGARTDGEQTDITSAANDHPNPDKKRRRIGNNKGASEGNKGASEGNNKGASDSKPRTVKEESEESEPPAEVQEDPLPDKDENTPIPVVNLERPEGSGADLERVQEALLHAGFAVGRKPTKKMENSNVLPEYIRLWR